MSTQHTEIIDGREFTVTVLSPVKGRVKRAASIKGRTGVPRHEQLLNADGSKKPRRRKSKKQRLAEQQREDQRFAYIPKSGAKPRPKI